MDHDVASFLLLKSSHVIFVLLRILQVCLLNMHIYATLVKYKKGCKWVPLISALQPKASRFITNLKVPTPNRDTTINWQSRQKWDKIGCRVQKLFITDVIAPVFNAVELNKTFFFLKKKKLLKLGSLVLL